MTSNPGYQPDPTRQPGYQPPLGYGPPPGQPQYGQPGPYQQADPYGQPGSYGAPPGYPPQGGYGPPAPPSPYGTPPGYPPQGYAPRVPPELLAPWGQRMLSGLIDVVAPTIVFYIVIVGAAFTEDVLIASLGTLIGWLGLLAFIIWNSGYRQGTTGQSLGKGVVGTKLVRIRDGQPVGFGLAVGRHFAHILDGLPLYLGYLWPLWDEQKQTFADKICSTVVVKV